MSSSGNDSEWIGRVKIRAGASSYYDFPINFHVNALFELFVRAWEMAKRAEKANTQHTHVDRISKWWIGLLSMRPFTANKNNSATTHSTHYIRNVCPVCDAAKHFRHLRIPAKCQQCTVDGELAAKRKLKILFLLFFSMLDLSNENKTFFSVKTRKKKKT